MYKPGGLICLREHKPVREMQYYIYIITNKYHTVLYTGVTDNLERRILEHKSGKGGTFSSKYHLSKLVYFESGNDIKSAISREKQIKGGSRQKKIELINSMNPGWDDLYEEFFEECLVTSAFDIKSSNEEIAST
jgi:putative endonuclease